MINKLMSLLLLIGLLSQALATGMPVIDIGAIEAAYKNFSQLKRQYDLSQEQYGTMKNQLSDMQGSYGWGSYQNGASDLNDEQWGTGTFSNVMKGSAGGNSARYKQLRQEYTQNHAVVSNQDATKSLGKGEATAYQQNAQLNETSAAQARQEFENLSKDMKTLRNLASQIDKTQNLKASMDLNSRIEIQIGLVQVEILRMQTMVSNQLAALNAARIHRETIVAKANKGAYDNDQS